MFYDEAKLNKILSTLAVLPRDYIVGNITWIEFLEAILNEPKVDLPKYFKLKSAPRVTELFKDNYPNIFLMKRGRPWKSFLLSIIDHKECPKCSRVQPNSNFHLDVTKSSGLKSTCISCRKVERHIYYINNKSLHRYNDSNYRARLLNAVPYWADLDKVAMFYHSCPEGSHVDHIVPLQNDLVCGLHCEFNLQHLTATENLSKGNRFEI